MAWRVSLRGALELLAVAYNFDCVESDHQLRFRKRGRPVSRVIAEAELAPINDEGDLLSETRAQEAAARHRGKAGERLLGLYRRHLDKHAGPNNHRLYLNGARALGIGRHVSGIADPFNGHSSLITASR
jgi:Putative phage tail protein